MDRLIVYQAQIECRRTRDIMDLSCHHLLHMREVNYTDDELSAASIDDAWNYFSCSVAQACTLQAPKGQGQVRCKGYEAVVRHT